MNRRRPPRVELDKINLTNPSEIKRQLADAIAENERLWDALQEANASCARHYDRAVEAERRLDIAREALRMLESAFSPRFSRGR